MHVHDVGLIRYIKSHASRSRSCSCSRLALALALSLSVARALSQAYEQLVRGDDGMILEKDISPAADVPVMADIKSAKVRCD